MSRSTRTSLTAAALAAMIVLPAAPALAHGDDPNDSGDHLSKRERLTVLAATRQFRDPAAAVAAGYLPTDECSALPGVGGMGYHYLNPRYAADDVIDPAHPEVLVYVPGRHGARTLGAVEYFRADADQDLSTDGDRPSLFGRHPFEGPMLGHEPGMPIHYDKHVWLYRKNPSGQLSPWNPRVSCPAD